MIERMEDVQNQNSPPKPARRKRSSMQSRAKALQDIVESRPGDCEVGLFPMIACRHLIPGVIKCHDKLKLLIIAGARPNFMKVAPLIKCIRPHRRRRQAKRGCRSITDWSTPASITTRRCPTFFSANSASRRPDINLGVGSGSHAVQTANVMAKFEPVCEQERPDWVVVVGDVNSTMACTLVCAKMGIKVAHVEAGLRSFDRTMPEEVNRIVTDSLADLLLTPSPDADENLKREGIPDAKIGWSAT